MIEKKNLIKSLDFFKDIELKDEDITLIYGKFKKMLREPMIEEILRKKMAFVNDKKQDEKENIRALMELLVSNLELEDFNLLLNYIVKDEDLSDFLQDFFLEKLI